jgi:NAD(P)-dependent dehydrogenase (short-subunit alcohol dehydrogenase family)
MTNLKNKVAPVTGSARGVGEAIARRYGALWGQVSSPTNEKRRESIRREHPKGEFPQVARIERRARPQASSLHARRPGWIRR